MVRSMSHYCNGEWRNKMKTFPQYQMLLLFRKFRLTACCSGDDERNLKKYPLLALNILKSFKRVSCYYVSVCFTHYCDIASGMNKIIWRRKLTHFTWFNSKVTGNDEILRKTNWIVIFRMVSLVFVQLYSFYLVN